MTRDEEPQITRATIDVYRSATRTSGEGYVPERGYRFTYADGSHSEAFYLTEEQQVIFERQEAKRREDFHARLVTAEVPDTHEDEGMSITAKPEDDLAAQLQKLVDEMPETISLDDLQRNPWLHRLVLAADDLSGRTEYRALEWAKTQGYPK